MPAQVRILRRRIRATQSMRKITKAQELIATSRIAKAQARVEAARPYTDGITGVVSALAETAALDPPLLVERENPQRAGVLVVTSDRGLAGGYNANVLRRAEELQALLREQGKEPVLYVIGRKGVNYYRFRQRELAGSWTGFSEQPTYAAGAEAARPRWGSARAAAFGAPGRAGPEAGGRVPRRHRVRGARGHGRVDDERGRDPHRLHRVPEHADADDRREPDRPARDRA